MSKRRLFCAIAKPFSEKTEAARDADVQRAVIDVASSGAIRLSMETGWSTEPGIHIDITWPDNRVTFLFPEDEAEAFALRIIAAVREGIEKAAIISQNSET
jgi:hypothetical protein